MLCFIDITKTRLFLYKPGVQEWPDGSSYKGDFVGNMRHGVGDHKWANGEVRQLYNSCFI